MDWQDVVDTAALHGILPLVAWTLRQTCPEAVPGDYLAELGDYLRENTLRNLGLAAELKGLLALLAENGVEVLPYKGVALAAAAYDNLALRAISDLDIVIRRRDIGRAKDVLIGAGYTWCDAARLHGVPERAYQRYAYHYVFSRGEGTPSVEVHWRFVRDPEMLTLTDEALWAGLESVSVAGLSLPCIRAEAMALILCGHGAKHLWADLGPACDLAALIRRREQTAPGGFGWGEFRALAAQHNCQTFAALGLLIARGMVGLRLPDQIDTWAESQPSARALSDEISRGFFKRGRHQRYNGVQTIVRDLRLRPRLRDKWMYITQRAWMPDAEDARQAGLLFAVARALRPLRLAGRYGVRIARELLGKTR
jgi:hypothetical protein